MPDYFAVFKQTGCAVPSTLSYQATGVAEAINHMIKQARVSSTQDFDEYEIMEVVDFHKYKPVALKEGPKGPKISKKETPVTKVEAAPVQKELLPTAERDYIPYTTTQV